MSQFRFDDLRGRVAVLTGAAHGIGKVLSRPLVDQGVTLVLIDRDEPALVAHADALRAAGGAVTAEVCDLADEPALRATIERIKVAYETVDAVIHNAAVDQRFELEQMTLAQYRRMQAVNVEPAIVLVQSLLPNLRRSRAARVLLMGSIMFELGPARLSAYTASKGTIVALTRCLAHELGDDGVTVNCIAPGAIAVEKESQNPHRRDDRMISWQSVKRRLTPDDLAGPVCLLLSEAGGGISGQIIGVDGGIIHPLASKDFQGTVPGREA